MSTPLGEHDVCKFMDARNTPAGYRSTGTISKARRVHFRHILQGIKHQVGDLRNALAYEHLNADGAMIDLEKMINGLMAVRKGLADPHRKTAKVMNGEVEAGDTVAYSTRSGSGHYMSIAKVLEVTEAPKYSWGPREDTVPALKVEVSQSTYYGDLPRKTTLTVLRRVVKL